MAKHKEYYKEEGGGFPQVWARVSFVNLCMPMVHLCTKSVATLALGPQPRQGLTKVWAKNEARESHFILLGV